MQDNSYPHAVRIEFRPYDHLTVRKFLHNVVKDFGKNNQRWTYRTSLTPEVEPNVWILDFQFQDPYDATVFGLKYSR